jgi:hypothetical protein
MGMIIHGSIIALSVISSICENNSDTKAWIRILMGDNKLLTKFLLSFFPYHDSTKISNTLLSAKKAEEERRTNQPKAGSTLQIEIWYFQAIFCRQVAPAVRL